MQTPHIVLENEIGFAKTVLMPGDPKRAEYIAKNFLDNSILINNVRGIQGYTGHYKGSKVSVMASGMGMPSIGIYSYELYKFFGVDNIIRVGSAGATREDVKLADIVMAKGAYTNSSFLSRYNFPSNYISIPNDKILQKAISVSQLNSVNIKVGDIYSSDTFYDDEKATAEQKEYGSLAVEMETAALYCNAKRFNKNALTICTISDLCYDLSQSMTALQREKSLDKMIKIALDITNNL